MEIAIAIAAGLIAGLVGSIPMFLTLKSRKQSAELRKLLEELEELNKKEAI